MTLQNCEDVQATRPEVQKRFRIVCADLQSSKQLVVYPGTERFPLGQGTEAIGLRGLAAEIQAVQ